MEVFGWGKRKLGDSDGEDDSDEGEEGENQKSVIIDIGSHSDSSKEAEGSSGSITDGKLDAGFLDQGSSGGGSEEEDNVGEESCGDDGTGRRRNNPALGSLEDVDHNGVDIKVPHESGKVEERISQLPGVSCSEVEGPSTAEVSNSTISEPVQKEAVFVSAKVPDVDKPLNFDELEVLGKERLKADLQARGLKCGGTLQERAARIFLLKTTPFELLSKKLFAKK